MNNERNNLSRLARRVRAWPVALATFVILTLLVLAGCNNRPITTEAELSNDHIKVARAEAESIVIDSEAALAALSSGADEAESMRSVLGRARAVIIFPGLFKAGFLIGGEGGTGVLLVRHDDGTWSDPSFVSTGSFDIGLFAGGQASQVVLAIMNDGALDAVLRRRADIGVDVSVAAASFGIGAGIGTTTNFGADIYTFSDTAGLYLGAVFSGGAILPRTEYNQAYYGAVDARDSETIVLQRTYSNPQSASLRSRLADVAGG
ncbi:MAG: lipid-binding SYLF domain-containing protein [Alphaproteobacteria bacterium]